MLGLAVSGGPDSMAMLLLAQKAIPGRFEVATVDHGLRPEAKDECALVVAACKERGVPCDVRTVTVPDGNVQAEARGVRYVALYQVADDRGWAAIATAHHADDQAETLLMRLNRGSGSQGLCGVRERSFPLEERYDEAPVIRPLLHFRRSELAGVVAAAGVPVARDPSNEDERFDRVRIRRALAEADWLNPVALARSAAHLADADHALNTVTNDTLERCTRREGDRIICIPPREGEVAFRVVSRIITQFGGTPRGSDVTRLIDRLLRGESGNVAGVLATARGGEWIFRAEPPRRTG